MFKYIYMYILPNKNIYSLTSPNHVIKTWALGPYDRFNPAIFIEVILQRQESERSCVMILSLFLWFSGRLDFGTVHFVNSLFLWVFFLPRWRICKWIPVSYPWFIITRIILSPLSALSLTTGLFGLDLS